MNSRRLLSFPALLLIWSLVLLPLSATPQKPDLRKSYSLIFGTVFGPDDHPAVHVVIMIRLANEKKARWELLSDRHGEFAQRFPPGPADYVVWADVKDKQLAEKTAVKVHIDNDERQDIALHLTK